MLGILIFILILLAEPFNLFCVDTLKLYKTNEVVVLSEDEQLSKSSAAQELDLSDFHLLKYKSVDLLLNDILGFDSRRNSKNEGYFRMRGFDQRQVGIFLDGIPIVTQYDGMVDLYQFPTSSISKVSVSKGLSSLLYGANNLAGSINLITENSFRKNLIEVKGELGNVSKNFGVKLNQRLSNFYFISNLDYIGLDNFNTSRNLSNFDRIDNSYSKTYSLFFKVVNPISRTFLHNFTILFNTGDRGIPVNIEATRKRFWKMPEFRNILLNYAFAYSPNESVFSKTNIYFTNFYNVIDSYDDSTYSTQLTNLSFHSTQSNKKIGFSSIFELRLLESNLTKIGIRYDRETQDQQSNYSQPWKTFQSELASLSLEQNLSYKNFGGIVGLNLDYLKPNDIGETEHKKSISFLNYQVGANYSSEVYNVYANFAHKSRFPTLKELYAEVLGANKPNPNLKSEFANLYELGVSVKPVENINFRASFYYNDVRNLIDIIVLEDKSRQFVNYGKVLLKGIEFSGNLAFYDFDFFFGLNYQEAENKTPSANNQIMPLRPKYLTNIRIVRSFNFGVTFEIQYLGYYNQYAYNSDKKQYFELPNYGLVNFSGSFKVNSNLTFSASVKNLFDVLYYSDWGYPQPGINFNLAMTLTL
ncbi:hypothetical protein D9V84_00435 [Bacteroidetes/Chlorobi group bacterium Naka2016]|jgi:outer membrane cobalamin receptor|nr:MAG: hypothetical protein D9V84_00435 [Bacteroidetes/Chlorobi group bacterium Naka2016]